MGLCAPKFDENRAILFFWADLSSKQRVICLTVEESWYYCITMRTSIFMDDELAASLRTAAKKKGLSLSAFLAEAGRQALRAESREAEPYDLVCYGSGGLREGVDLDGIGGLVVAEDAEVYRS